MHERHTFLRHLLLGLMLLLTGVLTAQTYRLSMQVIDGGTKEGLPFATVRIMPGDRGGATDVDGRYSLRLSAGDYTVTVSYVGYREGEVKLKLRRDTSLAVALETEATGLQLVEVSGNSAEAALTRPVMGVERLTPRELEVLPAALGEVDVLRGLQSLPGVGSAGEASNGLSVRGGSIDQNLVLLDHAPVFNPTHLFGLFSVFPSEGLGSIDLYRANVPARFGGRVASVLDVRTRMPGSNQFLLSGGLGIVTSRLSVEAPLIQDQLHVLAGVRVGFNDFWFKFIERLKHTRANFADALLKLRWRPNDRHTFALSGFYSKDYYQIDLISRFSNITADRNGYDYGTLNGSLDWQYSLSDRTFLQTVLVHADFKPSIIFPEAQTDNEVVFRSRLRYLELNSRLFHQPNDAHALLGGIQLNRYANLPGVLDPGTSTIVNEVSLPTEFAYEAALFAEDTWTVSQGFSLSLGLRYSHYWQVGPLAVRSYTGGSLPDEDEVTGQATYGTGKVISQYGGLEPRLGLSYRLHERVSVKAAYALMRQYLQNVFNSTTPLPTSRWKTSDPHIRPQRSQLVSLGFFYEPGVDYSLSMESYYRLTDNILEYRPGADFLLQQFVETSLLQGRGRAYGLEISLQKMRGKHSGAINYAYARGQNRVSGATFSERINDGDWYANNFDRPHTFNVLYTLAGDGHNSMSLNLTINSGRPYSVPNGVASVNGQNVPLFLERNNGRLPTYHRLDFSWRIHNPLLKESRWVGDWIFTIYNIYGRKNAYNIYYTPRDGNGNSHIFGSSPLASYKLSIFGAPIFSLAYQFRFK